MKNLVIIYDLIGSIQFAEKVKSWQNEIIDNISSQMEEILHDLKSGNINVDDLKALSKLKKFWNCYDCVNKVSKFIIMKLL